MARRDGSGPLGRGPLTGRGLGVCNEGYIGPRCRGGNNLGMGMGAGRRMGPGRGWNFGPEDERSMAYGPVDPNSEKDLLSEEREILKDRLNRIEDQLKNL